MDRVSRKYFWLWIGAAISIAEIYTGSLLAPLGLGKGLAAILIGHLIGCFGFLLPAGVIAEREHKTAIQSTSLSFGRLGATIFAGLNGFQLIGWTAVMIVNAAVAMNGISGQLFGFQNNIVTAVIVAALIAVWLILDRQQVLALNSWVVGLLLIGVVIIFWTIFTKPAGGVQPDMPAITFSTAIELNIAMALSWLPVIGDYMETKQAGRSIQRAMASVVGYFTGSILMFVVGLLMVTEAHAADFAELLMRSGWGMVALFIIVFSTVTTTFLDANSAALSLAPLFKLKQIKPLAVGVTVIGLLIAVVVPLTMYEGFLTLIGAFFAPLYIILFINYFLLKRQLSPLINFIWWVAGILGYTALGMLNLGLSQTIILAIVLCIGLSLTSWICPKELKHND